MRSGRCTPNPSSSRKFTPHSRPRLTAQQNPQPHAAQPLQHPHPLSTNPAAAAPKTTPTPLRKSRYVFFTLHFSMFQKQIHPNSGPDGLGTVAYFQYCSGMVGLRDTSEESAWVRERNRQFITRRRLRIIFAARGCRTSRWMRQRRRCLPGRS